MSKLLTTGQIWQMNKKTFAAPDAEPVRVSERAKRPLHSHPIKVSDFFTVAGSHLSTDRVTL